jgi:dsDNA-specific endonuclease/ATPase MutS2
MLVDEALRCEEHPGITFRPGPTGRRAGLTAGPDVWEVIDTLENVRNNEPGLTEDALVAATAEAMGLPAHKVHAAVRYYAAYSAEVNERIRANREAAAEAEAAARARHDVLRGEHLAS